ncbi:MAG: radical SAM protein [Elusimicrobia bacterium]|nr:radical SAM protein [Elusimicrobiota bacterium]
MNKLRQFLDVFGDSIAAASSPQQVTVCPPTELHIELTYRCNTACVMCNLRYLTPDAPELTLPEIKNFIEHSNQLNKISYIVLSGGEAFLRPDLVDIIVFLRARYPRAGILILSNLIDTDLVVSRMKSIRDTAGLDNLSIGTSLDGIADAHDRIRGKQGSFDALQRTVGFLKKEFPSVFFSFNFTLTPDNCEQILPTFLWAQENKYHISYQAMVQKQETKQFVWQNTQIDDVDRQITAIIEYMCRQEEISPDAVHELLTREGLLSQMLALHYIPRYLREPRRYFLNCPCGSKYAMIDPRGNVYFCPVHKTTYAGNVHRQSFDALWSSNEADAARSFFNRRECHCWLTCTNGYMLGTAIADGKKPFIRSMVTDSSDD